MRKLQILLFWLLCAESYAQVEVSAGAGIGWFNMSELGKLQKTIQSSYPVDAKITEEFPAYVVYDAQYFGSYIVTGSWDFTTNMDQQEAGCTMKTSPVRSTQISCYITIRWR